MAIRKGGLLVWFGLGRERDARILQAWNDAPLTYTPGDEVGPEWNVDRYEVILGQDATGDLFRRAADLVLHNRLYPAEVMSIVSDYSLEDRPVQVGDRVLQRIRILAYEEQPLLEVLTLNQITEVIQEPRRAGFTYTTTSAHSEIGDWSPRVEWRENGEVALIIEVASRSRQGASYLARRLTRQMQLRAHALSIENFKAQLSGRPVRRPEPTPRFVIDTRTRAAVLLLVAFILLVNMVTGFRRHN